MIVKKTGKTVEVFPVSHDKKLHFKDAGCGAIYAIEELDHVTCQDPVMQSLQVHPVGIRVNIGVGGVEISTRLVQTSF
jgi:hypothetical protein